MRTALIIFAVVLLLGSAALVLWPATAERSPTPGLPPPSSCDTAAVFPPALLPNASTASVVLEARGGDELVIDGSPVFAPLEKPLRLAPGEHRVEVHHKGLVLQSLRFRFSPFRAALFFFDGQPDAVLLWRGADCLSCGLAGAQFDLSPTGDAKPLSEVVALIRSNDLSSLPDALRAVAVRERQSKTWPALVAVAYLAAARDELALPHLQKTAWPGKAFEQLQAVEREREAAVLLDRWNLLTERFSRLTAAAQGTANGPISVASARFAELSTGFTKAVETKDRIAQDETVRVGEATLGTFLKSARAARPLDCAYQQRLSQAL